MEETSALPRAIASSKGTDYSSCERASENESESFALCLVPPMVPMVQRVAKRHSLTRLHGFNVFRDRPVHEEFDTSEGVGTLETALNILNMTIGAGVLVLPFAVQNGGWIILFILLAYAGWCGASHWMLGVLLAEVDQEAVRQGISRERRGWNILAEASMGKVGRKVVEGIVWAECYGIQLSFLILAGRCLHVLAPSISTHVHILCLGAMLGPLLFVPVQLFAIFSFVGFIAYCMICAGITISGIELGGWDHIQNQEHSFVVSQHLLSSIGVVNFVYNGHVGAPTFYQAMKDRRSWATAVSWATVGIFCFSIAFAAVPCAIFGAATKQSIIENVGRGMDHKILEEPFSKSTNTFMAQACGAMVALKLFVTLPTFAQPVVFSLEYVLDVQERSSLQVIGRVLYAIVTAAIAAAIAEHLALFVSVVGCVTNNAVSFLLPSLMYIIIKWDSLDSLSLGGLSILVLVSFVQLVGGLCLAFQGVFSDVPNA